MANVPPPRDQLATSTCTSWSVTYAAASQATRRNGLGAGVTLSPAYTYNQVSGDRVCHPPTSISKTLELLREHGALPIEEFVFDPGWCGRQPTEAERKRAQRYCITDWSRFEAGNVEAVKAQIARGVPVIFNMRVGTKLRGQRGDGVIDSDEVTWRTCDGRGRLRQCQTDVPHPKLLAPLLGRRRLRLVLV